MDIRRYARASVVVLLAGALLLTACGSDDAGGSGSGSDTEAPEEVAQEETGAPAEWCNAMVEAKASVIAMFNGAPPEDVEPLLATAEETAPEEISDTVTSTIADVRAGLKDKDGRVFESPDFRARDEEIDQYVVENCGFERVEVTAVDYELQGLPETLPAGEVISFDWSNEGNEVHEMTVVRFEEEGLTLDELLEMPQKEARSKVRFIGGSFGPPGETDAESMTLEAGTYGFVCFIPQGATSMEELRTAKGKPHAFLGMATEVTVE